MRMMVMQEHRPLPQANDGAICVPICHRSRNRTFTKGGHQFARPAISTLAGHRI